MRSSIPLGERKDRRPRKKKCKKKWREDERTLKTDIKVSHPRTDETSRPVVIRPAFHKCSTKDKRVSTSRGWSLTLISRFIFELKRRKLHYSRENDKIVVWRKNDAHWSHMSKKQKEQKVERKFPSKNNGSRYKNKEREKERNINNERRRERLTQKEKIDTRTDDYSSHYFIKKNHQKLKNLVSKTIDVSRL